MAKKLKITQVKSLIGSQPGHKATMKAIGFHRHQETLTKNDTPQLRGMLNQVRHLVHVEEVKAARKPRAASPKVKPAAKPAAAVDAPAEAAAKERPAERLSAEHMTEKDTKEAKTTEAPVKEEAATEKDPDKEKAE